MLHPSVLVRVNKLFLHRSSLLHEGVNFALDELIKLSLLVHLLGALLNLRVNQLLKPVHVHTHAVAELIVVRLDGCRVTTGILFQYSIEVEAKSLD